MGQPNPVAVEHLVERSALARRERDELVTGIEPRHARRGVVREQETAFVVGRRDALLDSSQDARELLARLVQGLLSLRPLGDGGEVVRDRPREEDFAIAPAMRRVPVEHELPEQAAAADKRHERERPDALLPHDALERRLEPGAGDILDENRLRVVGVRRPRRVPLGEGAVAVGEAAPGAEPEHTVVVGEQDGGPVGAGGLEQRVERRLEHLLEHAGARNGVGEAVDGVEVAQPPAQLLALADVARRPEHEADLPFLVADRGAVHLEPCKASAAPAQPDRDGVHVGSGGNLEPRLRGPAGVVRVDQLEHLDPGERSRLPADVRPGRRRVDDRAGWVAERDEIVRALDDEPADGVVDGLRRCRERLCAPGRLSAPQSALRSSSQSALSGCERPALVPARQLPGMQSVAARSGIGGSGAPSGKRSTAGLAAGYGDAV